MKILYCLVVLSFVKGVDASDCRQQLQQDILQLEKKLEEFKLELFLLKAQQNKDTTFSSLFPQVLVNSLGSGDTLQRTATLYNHDLRSCKVIYGQNNIVITVNQKHIAWRVEEDSSHDIRNYEWNGKDAITFFRYLDKQIEDCYPNIIVNWHRLKFASKDPRNIL